MKRHKVPAAAVAAGAGGVTSHDDDGHHGGGDFGASGDDGAAAEGGPDDAVPAGYDGFEYNMYGRQGDGEEDLISRILELGPGLLGQVGR